MAKAIQIQVNVDLLDLAKAYKGKKGSYITLSGILNDAPDQYENFGFIKQFVDVNSAKDMPILGNIKLKDFEKSKSENAPKLPAQNKVQVENLKDAPVVDDDLPF